MPNQGDGVDVFGSNGLTIGGTTAGAGNLISGNQGAGFLIDDGHGDVLQGNVIGTDTAGTAALPNQGGGVLLEMGASATRWAAPPPAPATSSPATRGPVCSSRIPKTTWCKAT